MASQTALTVEERYELITRRQHLFEPSTTEESLKQLLTEKTNPNIAWVTAPTGKPHIGYLVPLTKFVDFLRAGLNPTILYVDLYALLVNRIHPLPLIAHRQQYYQLLTTAVLTSLGIKPFQITHVIESSYAYTHEFTKLLHQMLIRMKREEGACTDEVRQGDTLSPLLCAAHQSLSEIFLEMDIQYGGLDQKGLFAHSVKFVPLIDGQKRREHLMNGMLASLEAGGDERTISDTVDTTATPTRVIVSGEDGGTEEGYRVYADTEGKMSASHAASTKIEFLDSKEVILQKITSAHFEERDVSEKNGVLMLLRDVIWPIFELRYERKMGKVGYNVAELDVEQTDVPEWIGSADDAVLTAWQGSTLRKYTKYEEFEEDFKNGLFHRFNFKMMVANYLIFILEPVRRAYLESEEWQMVERLGYEEC